MSDGLKAFIQAWIINTLGVLVAAHLVSGIHYETKIGLVAFDPKQPLSATAANADMITASVSFFMTCLPSSHFFWSGHMARMPH